MKISLIAAAAKNRVIGHQNVLPWYIPADLKRFREETTGKPVIMGRATHHSIEGPLPDRPDIILTATKNFRAPGCIVVNSVSDALKAAGEVEEVMVIGGGSVYIQFLPLAERIYLTEIHAIVDGGIRFPKLKEDEWKEISRKDFRRDEENPYDYSFTVLERVKTVTEI